MHTGCSLQGWKVAQKGRMRRKWLGKDLKWIYNYRIFYDLLIIFDPGLKTRVSQISSYRHQIYSYTRYITYLMYVYGLTQCLEVVTLLKSALNCAEGPGFQRQSRNDSSIFCLSPFTLRIIRMPKWMEHESSWINWTSPATLYKKRCHPKTKGAWSVATSTTEAAFGAVPCNLMAQPGLLLFWIVLVWFQCSLHQFIPFTVHK